MESIAYEKGNTKGTSSFKQESSQLFLVLNEFCRIHCAPCSYVFSKGETRGSNHTVAMSPMADI